MICNDCPRRCGADRSIAAGKCKTGDKFVIARAALHFWEEPPISGTRGSGAVFFSGCNMNCVYCQNYEISATGKGFAADGDKLFEIFMNIAEQNPHNLNLVTPSHYAVKLAPVLEKFKSRCDLPVVYNSGGYDSKQALSRLDGLIDVYLPDLKYGSDEAGKKYSGVSDYFSIAKAAVAEMRRQRPEDVFDEQGNIRRGVFVRHLILPGNVENSKKVLDFVSELDKKLYVSLMGQYFPAGNARRFRELDRCLKKSEYSRVVEYFFNLGLENGFVQEPTDGATESRYVPEFFTGEAAAAKMQNR